MYLKLRAVNMMRKASKAYVKYGQMLEGQQVDHEKNFKVEMLVGEP